MGIEVSQMDAVGRLGVAIKRMANLETALDLISSLVPPIGRSDSNLSVAQRIANEALAKHRAQQDS